MNDQLLSYLFTQSPLVVLLLLTLWAGSKTPPAWLFGNVHRQIVAIMESRLASKDEQIAEAVARAEEWQRIALANSSLARTAIHVGNEIADAVLGSEGRS